MNGCTAIKLSNMSKLVLSKLALFVLHYVICGSFHNKSTINASPLLWQNLDEDSFDMLYKNYCWEQPSLTQYERPMYHNERKINMLSSTDNNFMICLFDFERFSIESRCVFFLTHTVYFKLLEIQISLPFIIIVYLFLRMIIMNVNYVCSCMRFGVYACVFVGVGWRCRAWYIGVFTRLSRWEPGFESTPSPRHFCPSARQFNPHCCSRTRCINGDPV